MEPWDARDFHAAVERVVPRRRTTAVVLLAVLAVLAGCQLGPDAATRTAPGTPTPESTATASSPPGSPSPTDRASPTPAPTPALSFARGRAADAPPSGRAAHVSPDEVADLPRLYRRHLRAVENGTYRFRARIVGGHQGDRPAELAVRAVRGPEATLDRTVLLTRDAHLDGKRLNRTLAAYRTGEPTLYYRAEEIDGEPVRRQSGVLQGASFERRVGPVGPALPPWRARDLVHRLAAAGRYDSGTRVVVDGTTLTRYTAAGLDRDAYDALGLGRRGVAPEVLPQWRSSYEEPYPEYSGTIHVDETGAIRRVNLTLTGTPTAYRDAAPATIRLTGRLDRSETRVDVPWWVERTPRLRVRALDATGIAVAVEHRGGPPVDVSGALETGNATSRTVFPFLSTDTLGPGETLYVAAEPDDDGNQVEVRTTIGERPSAPFVRLSVRKFALSSRPTARSGRTGLTHEHYVALNATGENGRAG